MSTSDLRQLPPQSRLREMFDYDPLIGQLIRKRRSEKPNKFDSRWAGKPAGRKAKTHSYVLVDGEMFLVHRVIWKWMTGQDAPKDIDHRDLDPSNNRWDNLRIGGKSANGMNRRLPKNNKSGHRGVYWIQERWEVRLVASGKTIRGGRFDDYDEACQAWERAAKEAFGEFYRAD